MATDFNAETWAQINAPRTPKRDFNADFVEAVETREGMRSGMAPNQAVIRGMQARQTVLDPMFELKKSQAMLNIASTAQQFQENILSSQIKQRQIEDEAADTLALSGITKFPTWEEKMKALTEITPRSARGIQQAVQMRLQLSQLRAMDTASKAFAKLTPQQMARVNQFEQGTTEWWDAIEELSPKEPTQPETVTLIETAKKYRLEGDAKSADMIESILLERGRTKAGMVAPSRPFTITTEDASGNKITQRLTEEEYLARPVTDKDELALLKEYSETKAALSSGDMKRGPDWNPLATPRGQRMESIRAELKAKGIDADTGKRITGQPEQAVAQPNVTQSEYEKLRSGDLYWWNGKQIPKQ